jgi:hypothetical protein
MPQAEIEALARHGLAGPRLREVRSDWTRTLEMLSRPAACDFGGTAETKSSIAFNHDADVDSIAKNPILL